MHPRSTPWSRSRAAFVLLAVALAIGPVLLTARPAHAATTFVVTTAGDQPDADLTDPVCDANPARSGDQCTLRAAIQEANATPGADTIAFNIPGPPDQVKTIRPASDLPPIERKVTIDGYTQPGSKPNTAAKGTDAVLRIELDGSASSGRDGLRIDSAYSLVRGLVVNRFRSDGIEVTDGATGVRVEGCFLGTDAGGTAALGNNVAVWVDGAAVQIGGPQPAARNLIAGNSDQAVQINGDNARVLGNLIGTDRTGAAPLGNAGSGVDIAASGAVVGGAAAGQANVIAFNGGDGVYVGSGVGNRIPRNSIFANDGRGINLVDGTIGDGVTPNDPLDADDGANTLQNFPVIEEATSTRVAGTLHSTPNQDFVLRLFSNPGTQNEGKFFEEGPLLVTTDANGDASFAFIPNPPIPAGRSVTATATNQGGSTSEFSFPAVPVEGGPA